MSISFEGRTANDIFVVTSYPELLLGGAEVAGVGVLLVSPLIGGGGGGTGAGGGAGGGGPDVVVGISGALGGA